ncbi:hypothetical protein AB4308_20090, partial [Vibrio breoganii]
GLPIKLNSRFLPSLTIMFHDPVLESSLVHKEHLSTLGMPLNVSLYIDENGDPNVIGVKLVTRT